MQSFRFIHAANLLLDHQLQQINSTDSHLTTLAEESTLTAFRQLVRTAVEEEVDFLLLTGNCFDAADRSLLAEIALLRGLEELDEQGIDVYVVPGETDPAECWSSLPQLPENTTVVSGNVPVSVSRGDTPLATIYPPAVAPRSAAGDPFPIAFRRHEEFFPPISRQFDEERIDGPTTEYELISDVRDGSAEKTSLSREITANNIRYWVLSTGRARRTVYAEHAVAHHPGGTQAISAAQSGQHGCTLVEVDTTGEMELTFLPTAAVRFETVDIAVHPHWGRDELLNALCTAVAAIHRHPTEAAWLLSWQVRGYGHGRDLLADREFQHEIDDQLRARFHDMDVHICSMGMTANGEAVSMMDEAPSEGLAGEYWQALHHPQPSDFPAVETVADPVLIPAGPWERQLQKLEKSISEGDLLDRAAALGHEWFSEFTEEQA